MPVNLVILILLLVPSVSYGDIGWLSYWFLATLLFIRNRKLRKTGKYLAPLFLALISAHLLGFKLFGSATKFDNEPLNEPIKVVAFEWPNTLILEDSRRYTLQGYELDKYFEDWDLDAIAKGLFRIDEKHVYVEYSPTDDQLFIKVPNRIICGNTYHPRFFPSRMPRFHKRGIIEYISQSHIRFAFASNSEELIWQDTIETADLDAYSSFTTQFPKSKYIDSALARLSILESQPARDAAFAGDGEKLQSMLDSGISPDAENRRGGALIHIAADRGHHDIVRLLLNRGAPPNAKTNVGVTPLMLASMNGHLQIMDLLLNAAAEVNTLTFDSQNNALFLAVRDNRLDAVKKLIEAGALLHHQRTSGETVMDIANQKSQSAILSILTPLAFPDETESPPKPPENNQLVKLLQTAVIEKYELRQDTKIEIQINNEPIYDPERESYLVYAKPLHFQSIGILRHFILTQLPDGIWKAEMILAKK